MNSVSNFFIVCIHFIGKVRIPYGVIDIGTKEWLNKAISEGQKMVDLTGCYSNFSALNELYVAIKELRVR